MKQVNTETWDVTIGYDENLTAYFLNLILSTKYLPGNVRCLSRFLIIRNQITMVSGVLDLNFNDRTDLSLISKLHLSTLA